MRLKELIDKLQEIEDKEGDIEVGIVDTEEGTDSFDTINIRLESRPWYKKYGKIVAVIYPY